MSLFSLLTLSLHLTFISFVFYPLCFIFPHHLSLFLRHVSSFVFHISLPFITLFCVMSLILYVSYFLIFYDSSALSRCIVIFLTFSPLPPVAIRTSALCPPSPTVILTPGRNLIPTEHVVLRGFS